MILIVCPLTIITTQNMSLCPIIFDFVVPREGAKLQYRVHRSWRIAKRMGLHMYLKHVMMCLNLSIYLWPGSQISISARISEGSRSNNDACEGLRCFVGRYRRSVQQ